MGLALYTTRSSTLVLIADSGSHRIRSFDTTSTEVASFAGTGIPGLYDGATKSCLFHSPEGVTADGNGLVFVADTGSNAIRLIEHGSVRTLAGGSLAASYPVNGQGTNAVFSSPSALALEMDASNNAVILYVVDVGFHCIRTVALDGSVTTFAGSPFGKNGFIDGPAAASLFHFSPVGSGLLLLDGNLLVSDFGNHALRLVTGGAVRTFFGASGSDWEDESFTLKAPVGLAQERDGTLYIADFGAHKVFKRVEGPCPYVCVPTQAH